MASFSCDMKRGELFVVLDIDLAVMRETQVDYREISPITGLMKRGVVGLYRDW